MQEVGEAAEDMIARKAGKATAASLGYDPAAVSKQELRSKVIECNRILERWNKSREREENMGMFTRGFYTLDSEREKNWYAAGCEEAVTYWNANYPETARK
ncbi:hypothetical protein GVX82_04375 [Patescibacteria group bacterium]|nr:hypothetical protein [Patescibacteria group bacterium]